MQEKVGQERLLARLVEASDRLFTIEQLEITKETNVEDCHPMFSQPSKLFPLCQRFINVSAYPLLYRIRIHRIKNKHPEVILQGGLTSQLLDDLLW